MGIVDSNTEVEHLVHTSPVAESDGHAIRILTVEAVNVVVVFLYVGSQLLLVGIVHVRDSVEGCLHVTSEVQLECIPDLFLEIVEIRLLLRGAVELQIGGHVTELFAVSAAALHEFLTVLVRVVVLVPSGLGAVEPVKVVLHLLVSPDALSRQFGGFLHEAFRLGECPLCKVVVIAFQGVACSSKHRGCPQVELGTARGESPHVVRRSAALAVGTHLVRLQRRVVM